MDLEQNERTQEWFLIVGDWFRDTHKLWFYGFIGVFVVAIPLYMFLDLVFTEALKNSSSTLQVNYTEVQKEPLQVVETKVFDLGNDTYSGFARIKNANSDWGVPKQGYRGIFETGSGAGVLTVPGATFIQQSSDKVVFFPRFSSPVRPTSLSVELDETVFIRPPNLPALTLEIQRKSLDAQSDESVVNAVIVNRTPFKISRVDLPILLYDSSNRVIGANYTNINDLDSAESRSFQYVWYNRINNVARIEIIPDLNIFNREIFVTAPGQNPFDNIE